MSRDEIIATVGTIILALVVLGSFIWIIFGTDCSILADKCIVDEWSPKCLWVDCIVDGRGKE